MKPLKLIILLFTLWLMIVSATPSYADISNAAVLYLRIAPGARAAAMGDAFVAIADDATATHWNPAGLGNYPLSDSWQETKIPNNYQPVTALASLKTHRGNNYLAYEIWAITPLGLARYDNKKWYLYEEFNTRTNQTVRKIVASYFNITNEERLDKIVERVAVDNNEKKLSYLQELETKIMKVVPKDYSDLESLQGGFDSLLAGYNECLINWPRVNEIEKYFTAGMKDSTLTEKELDRINFAVEKSRNRFIPEKLIIYYSALFDGKLTSLASNDQYLMVGTDKGLYSFDSRRWQSYSLDDNLPSLNITAMKASYKFIYVGTDMGLMKFDGSAFSSVGDTNQLPKGAITAVDANGSTDIWTVVNNELYHYDGNNWSNNHEYTVILDDTPEKIAEKYAVYGTKKEKEKFLKMLYGLNKQDSLNTSNVSDNTDTSSVEKAVSKDSSKVTNTETSESNGPLKLVAGMKIKIPYLAEIKGKVNTIYRGFNNTLWIGTDYGLIYFDGEKWNLPGYRDYKVEQTLSVDSLVQINSENNPIDSILYKKIFKDINGIESDSVAAGQIVKIYSNPTAVSIKNITAKGNDLYFGSANGLIRYDGQFWSKVKLNGLDKANIIMVKTTGKELWFASDKKIVVKANGKTNISMMYVKWLPELADDLYYTFFSVVSNKDGWGTFGGNLTFISYGTIVRTNEQNVNLGSFDAFDLAVTLSYGTSLTNKLKGGISAKFLYSKLSDVGAGKEQGKGTSSGFALDFGLLYKLTNRFTLGAALTNAGPNMAYIDAAQADPLPLNLAFGFSYKLLQSDYYHFMVTSEINKLMVGLNDSFGEELRQTVINSGGEFVYADILALRAGYMYDQEGGIKTVTLGAGLKPLNKIKFDFSYIPSNNNVILENTLRISLSITP
ncbi:MAG: PorV/PorQ family protein [FCB group bacterium]|nr:PorV/PorQ family protein [FCB group bacterium]